MGRRKKGTPPPYLEDRSTGQAYATVGGRKTYFGAFGSKESRYRYERFLKAWERSHGQPVTAVASLGTIAEAVPLYLAEIREHLSPGEHTDIRRNLMSLADRFGSLEPDDFRPQQFKDLRASWMSLGWHRTTIVKASGRIKRFFRWLVSEERCQPETLGTLLAVLPLPKGKVAENPPVEPVPLRDYLRTIRRCGRTVRAMARLQFYAGPRPGEVCRMRGSEIHKEGSIRLGRRNLKIPRGVWLFVPSRAKKDKSGRATVYLLGPRAQAVLRPFLRDDPDAYLFDPRESRREWEAEKRAARKTPVQPSQADRSKAKPLVQPGRAYTVASYDRAITRAARRAGVPHWTPHQVRHAFASRIERETDLMTASTMLSHEAPGTTLIYLERKIASAAGVALKMG